MSTLQPHKVLRRALSAVILVPAILVLIWQGGAFFGALLGVIVGLALAELWKMAVQTQARMVLFTLMSLYMLAGVLFCYHLRVVYGMPLTVLFFFALWGSDIGAYFSGKFIGGAKLSPGLSPNKTWAGYIGALLAPALVLSLAALRFDPALIFGGVALGVAGQAGDLLISAIKRDAHVKDTGDLIPGHGGILDRIDSLIPAVFVYLALIKAGIVVW